MSGIDDDDMSCGGVEELMDRTAWEAIWKAGPLVDQFTGLGNRHALNKQLEELGSQERPVGTDVAVFLLDLDNFIYINDRYGHNIGDELLLIVARRLQNLAESTGWAYRMGGDEFVLVLTGISGRAGATMLAERIVEAIRAPLTSGELREPSLALDGTLITAAVGNAIMTRGSTPRDLLVRADYAMFAAKQTSGHGHPGRGYRALLFNDLPLEQRLRAQELEAE